MFYLTTQELATILKVSKSTILKKRKYGLPSIQLSERTIRYDLEKVKQWLDEEKFKDTAF